MITVITNEGYRQPVENPYSKLTLAEACDQMIFDIHESINEFMQDTLLTEHAYLLENGYEITYTNEAGDETKEGSSLKERARKVINRIKEFVGNILNKCKQWVIDKINLAKDAIIKISFKPEKYAEAVHHVFTMTGNIDYAASPFVVNADTIVKDCQNDDGYIFGKGDGNFDGNDGGYYDSNNTYYDKYIKDHKDMFAENKNLTSELAISAGNYLFKSAKTVKAIDDAKKSADKWIKDYEKLINTEDPDMLAQEIQNVKNSLDSNAAVCKDKIKLYTKVINDNFAVVKFVISKYKASSKELGSIKKKVNGKEIEESASLYDGKYFRV